MPTYHNPIRPGFHPDPTICRVGDDYYLANSTFQWWPGVRLAHSRDLVHWRDIGYALTRPEQLNLRGVDDSMGVWAPTLRFFNGAFHLIVSVIRPYHHGDAVRMSIENRLYTARDIRGPWDDGVYIHDTGIDPDIFQDTDGRLYIACQDTLTGGGPRPERISIQEYDPDPRRLTGPRRVLWDGTPLGVTEGPHLYHRDGWYYLVTAEGGTFYGHAVSLCRSRSLFGPFEVAPHNPILTMAGRDATFARSGHADLVETPNGEWWMVCLGGRSDVNRRSILGRETFLLPVRWTPDGWLEVNGGRGLETGLPAPDLPEWAPPERPSGDAWRGPDLPVQWQAVRALERDHIRFEGATVRLRARPEPLEDIGAVNVIGRRQQHHRFTAEVTVDFTPERAGERAGIACYYDRRHFIAFAIGHEGGPILEVRRCDGDDVTVTRIPHTGGPARLHVEGDGAAYRFSVLRSDPTPVGPPQDGGHLSDEGAGVVYPWAAFTGAFLCLFATGNGARSDRWAAFESFEYRPGGGRQT